MATENNISSPTREATVEEAHEVLSSKSFLDWYRERQYRQNIENGKHYFNGVSSIPESTRHNPSQLLQCHRKIVYRQENAPVERADPMGIFWFGTRFEENLIIPFLRETLTDDDTYVRNSVWVDFTVETSAGDIRIKGETDPLIVDADAVPILPSEVKTKASVDNLDSPSDHHRAQLHAYVHGLNEKFGSDLEGGIILYGSRESLDVKSFYVQFDPDFWTETVLNWAESHTEFRLGSELPPADPEYDWECRFCSFQERCGKGETEIIDGGTTGLLPGFRDYPEEKLIDYFEAYPNARLPPSLAGEFPQLAVEYGVYDWKCRACNTPTEYDNNHSGGQTPPACPNCASRGVYAELTDPSLAEQEQQIETTSTDGESNA